MVLVILLVVLWFMVGCVSMWLHIFSFWKEGDHLPMMVAALLFGPIGLYLYCLEETSHAPDQPQAHPDPR